MGTLLAAYALALVISAGFAASGGFLFRRAVGRDLNPGLVAGGGFFLGMALFLSVMRTVGWVAPVAAGLGAGLLAVFGVGGYALYLHRREAVDAFKGLGSSLWLAVGVGLALAGYSLLTELPFLPADLSVMDSLGSLHAGRYANLATAIVEGGSIPVVNQNYGQSLLAAALMLLGIKAPFLALHVWLTLSKVFFLFAVLGFFRHLGLEPKKAALAACLVYLGNTALSLTFVLVGDSGFPWAIVGYTDTLAGGATLLALAVCLMDPPPAESYSGGRAATALALPALLGLQWQMQSPQNLLVLLPALGLLGLAAVKRGAFPGRPVTAFVGALLVFFAVGAFQGGMLTPKSLLTTDRIPGLMLAASERPTSFNPVYPNVRFSGPQAVFFPNQQNFAGARNPSTPDFLFALESNLWDALRMAFFPLLGFTLGGWFLSRRGALCPNCQAAGEDRSLRVFGALWLGGAALYATGFAFAFPISYHGYKWELARFFLPGYLAGMSLLALTLERMELTLRSRRLAWGFVLLFSVGATLFFHIPGVAEFLKASPSGQTFGDRIDLLANTRGMLYR